MVVAPILQMIKMIKVALEYLDSAVGLGAVDEKLFVARSRCLTNLER